MYTYNHLNKQPTVHSSIMKMLDRSLADKKGGAKGAKNEFFLSLMDKGKRVREAAHKGSEIKVDRKREKNSALEMLLNEARKDNSSRDSIDNGRGKAVGSPAERNQTEENHSSRSVEEAEGAMEAEKESESIGEADEGEETFQEVNPDTVFLGAWKMAVVEEGATLEPVQLDPESSAETNAETVQSPVFEILKGNSEMEASPEVETLLDSAKANPEIAPLVGEIQNLLKNLTAVEEGVPEGESPPMKVESLLERLESSLNKLELTLEGEKGKSNAGELPEEVSANAGLAESPAEGESPTESLPTETVNPGLESEVKRGQKAPESRGNDELKPLEVKGQGNSASAEETANDGEKWHHRSFGKGLDPEAIERWEMKFADREALAKNRALQSSVQNPPLAPNVVVEPVDKALKLGRDGAEKRLSAIAGEKSRSKDGLVASFREKRPKSEDFTSPQGAVESSMGGKTTAANLKKRGPEATPTVFRDTIENQIFNEVVKKAGFQKFQDGRNVMQLQLKPEWLGKMNIEVVSHKGNLMARFLVENNEVKELVKSMREDLAQQFADMGLKFGRLDVDVQSGPGGNPNPEESEKGKKMAGVDKGFSRFLRGETTESDATMEDTEVDVYI